MADLLQFRDEFVNFVGQYQQDILSYLSNDQSAQLRPGEEFVAERFVGRANQSDVAVDLHRDFGIGGTSCGSESAAPIVQHATPIFAGWASESARDLRLSRTLPHLSVLWNSGAECVMKMGSSHAQTKSDPGKDLLLVADLVLVALLGEKQLSMVREVELFGIARHQGIEVGRFASGLRP